MIEAITGIAIVFGIVVLLILVAPFVLLAVAKYYDWVDDWMSRS